MGKKKDAEAEAKAARKAAKKAAKKAKTEQVPLVDAGHADRIKALAAEVAADREQRHGPVGNTHRDAQQDDLHAIATALDPNTPLQVAVEVTEAGDIAATTVGLTIAPVAAEVERDRWGRPYVITPAGERKGYRRVTTYIDVLEDKTALERYSKRTVLTGVALDYDQPSSAEHPSIVRRALDTVTKADAALAELAGNELASVNREAIEKARKDALDALTDEAYEVAGGHAKAQKGTDLHALTELVDQGLPLPEGITDADRADLAAYAATIKALGITFTDRERFVVNDELETGGTLDRAGLYKSERAGWQRARRVVMDIKTGRLDYSAGKIGMQLATYARSDAYDLATGERTPLKLDKKLGLLIHLPAGQATCQVYEVDLELAYRGLLLAREVYAWRRDGKAVYDLKAPLVAA